MCHCHRGDFRPGPDCRRHVFTPAERRQGGRTRGLQIRFQLAAVRSGDSVADLAELAYVGDLLRAHLRSWRGRR